MKHRSSKYMTKSTFAALTMTLTLSSLSLITGCDSVDNPDQTNEQFQSLSYDDFVTSEVFAVFDRPIGPNGESCSDAACHHAVTGQGGSFRVWPGITDGESLEMRQNFLSAAAFVNIDKPEASALLLEPLTATDGPFPNVGEHGGGDIFDSTDDSDYRTIYNWASNPVVNTEGDS